MLKFLCIITIQSTLNYIHGIGSQNYGFIWAQNKQLYNKTIKKVNISEFLKIHAYKNEGFYSICKRLLQHLKDEQSLKRMHTYIDIFQNK